MAGHFQRLYHQQLQAGVRKIPLRDNQSGLWLRTSGQKIVPNSQAPILVAILMEIGPSNSITRSIFGAFDEIAPMPECLIGLCSLERRVP
jgi:hypothetical protein